jgi:hypothetical protein
LADKVFSIAFMVLLFPNKRYVQNRMAFFPSSLGMVSMNAMVYFAGLAPSTGVPKITRSQFSRVDGWVEAKSEMGAFAELAIAWAKRFVFPVLEK